MAQDRAWVRRAIALIEAEMRRSADTHLIRVDLPGVPEIPLYLKDESVHPTGSLKHRLARSLFLYALCNGWIGPDTPIVEASSGSTAISEAWFARMLGLTFIAVMPRRTSREKIAEIEFNGGRCHLVDSNDIYGAAEALAAELGGHYMDQFTYAERATDWRGNNNIAESIFNQLAFEPFPVPRYVVVPAGTGGTSATIGRYIRYRAARVPPVPTPTELVVVDPENSVFFEHWHGDKISGTRNDCSRIEGIGRPRVEPSFVASVIDRMLRVPDAASLGTMRFLSAVLNRRCGGSTGTNVHGAFELIAEMRARGEAGAVVTLICDAGERYLDSYYNDAWVTAQGLDLAPHIARCERFYVRGQW